jgi:2,3-bisphosphoglycerate-independent phosphoglycerate mutase
VGIPVASQPTTAEDVCAGAVEALKDHTFVFAHFKYTDKTGEDGDLDAKVQRIEEMDAAIEKLLAGDPDVLLVTGDHSTPPSIKAHSWHPVPVLMKAPFLRGGDADRWTERTCLTGQIGRIPAKELLPLAMAHAGKLEKYGA